MTQALGSINNLYENSEQNQNCVNDSLHNQNFQGDSFLGHDQDLKQEQQQWDFKPDPYLESKQYLRPGLNWKSEELASTQHDHQFQDDKTIVSTQHQEYQADISMASSKSKEHNGL